MQVHYVRSIQSQLTSSYNNTDSKCPVPVISQSLHISAVRCLMFKNRLHPAEVYQNRCPEGTWTENMAFRQSKLIDVNRIKAAYSIVGSSILFFASSSLPRMAKIQAEEVVGRCWEPHVYTSHAKFCHM